MARSLRERVAARGFPVFDVSGQSGQGSLPTSTAPPARAGLPGGTWTDPNSDPASVPATQAPPELYVAAFPLWGLPGAPHPDNQPKSADGGPWSPQGGTHAAPMADPTLPPGEYYAEADATHAPEFTSVAVRNSPGMVRRSPLDHVYATGGDHSDQQPLTGPMRALAGFDAVQGYGGGADGPGGVNASMPVVTDQRNYPGAFYAADGFVSVAEVPFVVADADQFIPASPEMAPWTGGGFNFPGASTRAQQVTPADVPGQGPAISPSTASVPAYATSFWS